MYVCLKFLEAVCFEIPPSFLVTGLIELFISFILCQNLIETSMLVSKYTTELSNTVSELFKYFMMCYHKKLLLCLNYWKDLIGMKDKIY